jgi:hypothetical protein
VPKHHADDKSGRACVILTLNAILLLQTFGVDIPERLTACRKPPRAPLTALEAPNLSHGRELARPEWAADLSLCRQVE